MQSPLVNYVGERWHRDAGPHFEAAREESQHHNFPAPFPVSIAFIWNRLPPENRWKNHDGAMSDNTLTARRRC